MTHFPQSYKAHSWSRESDTWGEDIRNDQMAQIKSVMGRNRQRTKQTKKAEAQKNKKQTEGKSKSTTISQLDGYQDYGRNM